MASSTPIHSRSRLPEASQKGLLALCTRIPGAWLAISTRAPGRNQTTGLGVWRVAVPAKRSAQRRQAAMSVASVSYVMLPFLAPRAAEETVWTPILYFYKYRNMEQSPLPIPQVTRAATAFAALGSEARLSILHRLVRAGPSGLPIGALGEDVGITGSVLTHHVKHLVSAGLGRATPRRTAHPLLGRDRRGRGAFPTS